MERTLFDHMRQHVAISNWVGYAYDKQISGTDGDSILHTTAAVRRIGFPMYINNVDEYHNALNGVVTLEYTESNDIKEHPNHSDWFSDMDMELGSPHESMVRASSFVEPAELVEVFSNPKDTNQIGIWMITGNELLSIVVSLKFMEVVG